MALFPIFPEEMAGNKVDGVLMACDDQANRKMVIGRGGFLLDSPCLLYIKLSQSLCMQWGSANGGNK